MEYDIPGLKIKYEPFNTNHYREIFAYFELLNQLQLENAPLPQFIYVNCIPITFRLEKVIADSSENYEFI